MPMHWGKPRTKRSDGATLWIFGVPDAIFWYNILLSGFYSGIRDGPGLGASGSDSAFAGKHGKGIGILVVGAVVIINIDSRLRIMLAKRMGDIHPLVTLAGIVLGVPIFGIVGLVIGPLLLSYVIVLMGVFERKNRRQEQEVIKAEE